MMDLTTLRAFEDTIRRNVPSFKIAFKDESLSQKIIGFLSYPFNPEYMTRYTTTFYPSVYFPSKAYYEGQPKTSFNVLSHELVHLVDTMNRPLWFRLAYTLPQLLAIFPTLAFGIVDFSHSWLLGILLGGYVLACGLARRSMALFWCIAMAAIITTGILAVLLTHWFSVLFFLGLACLAPWPSPGRTKIEMRGYTMSLAIVQWGFGFVPDIYRKSIVSHFISGDYYFMDWDRGAIGTKVDAIVNQAQNGQLQQEYPYSEVYKFMSDNGLVKSKS